MRGEGAEALLLADMEARAAEEKAAAPPPRATAGEKRAREEGEEAFDWTGFKQSRIDGLARPLLVAQGSKGYAACAYVDVATADKLGEALVVFSGVATCDDFVASEVKRASKAAVALGVAEGMRGGEALELLR